jgi:transposase InsO family protein
VDIPTELELRQAQAAISQVDRTSLSLNTNADGLLVNKDDRIFVPDSRALRLRLFIGTHQGVGGHAAVDVSLAWLRARFWWPTMEADVRAAVAACSFCLKVKGGRVVPRPLLATKRATRVNEVIHFDYTYVRDTTEGTPGGYKYVLVLMDGFSKFVELVPAVTDDAQTVVNALLDWFKRFGVVNFWVSDRGTHFTAAVMAGLRTALGAHHHFTATYAAWSNGQVERVNRKLRETLSAMRMEAGLTEDQWPRLLPLVNAALNRTPTETLAGHCPMQVFVGRDPGPPLDVMFRPDVPQVVDLRDVREKCEQHVIELSGMLDSIWTQVSAKAPRKRGAPPGTRVVDFSVGEYVLVARPDAKLKDKTKPLWYGPALVTGQINERVFNVKDVSSGHEKEMHAQYLKRYADKDLTLTDEVLDFAAIGGDGFVIDYVREHRWIKGKVELLVCWEGFPDGEPTWESMNSILEDAPTTVNTYVKSIVPEEERRRVASEVTRLKKRSKKRKP